MLLPLHSNVKREAAEYLFIQNEILFQHQSSLAVWSCIALQKQIATKYCCYNDTEELERQNITSSSSHEPVFL